MYTEIEAARQLAYYGAWLYSQGKFALKVVSAAKLKGAQVACKVTDEALQIFGGYGYMNETPISQRWRDVRLSRIGGGTDEIQKEIIANQIMPKSK